MELNLKAQQQSMFGGVTSEQIDEGVRQTRMLSPSGAVMAAMSMLSDAQEEIALGRIEQARQTINRAKYVIATHLRDPKAK